MNHRPAFDPWGCQRCGECTRSGPHTAVECNCAHNPARVARPAPNGDLYAAVVAEIVYAGVSETPARDAADCILRLVRERLSAALGLTEDVSV